MYLDMLTSVFNMSGDSTGTVEILRAGFQTASSDCRLSNACND
jgi:hypothetical protein